MSATPTTQQTIAGGSNSEIGRKQPTSEDKVTKVVRWTFPTRLTPSKVTKHPPGGDALGLQARYLGCDQEPQKSPKDGY
ncbi:hypothetical protein BLNAU_24799 [Blattamonas nauphoetae]|uniref:Uncharacterized protein n=1 Tax=Blattamonas nauphoetae TaxID=2049346 RepID=A0ABQ9WLS7_9EUKA|nr:hypothetical protein BLNAU_24799 [Blattamonas nauphoetae]